MAAETVEVFGEQPLGWVTLIGSGESDMELIDGPEVSAVVVAVRVGGCGVKVAVGGCGATVVPAPEQANPQPPGQIPLGQVRVWPGAHGGGVQTGSSEDVGVGVKVGGTGAAGSRVP